MPKISRGGGPSYVLAEPGDVAEDALLRRSALHPDEQAAFPLIGEPDDDAWLTRDPEAPDGIARDDDGEPVRGKAGETVERDDEGREGSEDVSLGASSSPSSEKHEKSNDEHADDGRPHVSQTESRSNPDASPERSTVDSVVKSTTTTRKR